jgi:succinoglycan biosynthesis transport protein ExoP
LDIESTPPAQGQAPTGQAAEPSAQPAERSFGALLLDAVRHRWLLIIGCCVVAGAIALGLSLIQTKEYSATASLLFREPDFSNELFGVNTQESSGNGDRQAATNVKLFSLPAIDELAVRHLKGNITASGLQEKVSISSDSSSDVVSVTVTDSNPAFARKAANTFATTYISFRRDADRRKIKNALVLVEKRLGDLGSSSKHSPSGEALANQASRLQTLKALQTGNAELVQHADLPTSPSSPTTVRNTLAAAVIGLLLGIAVAILLERMDRRLRHIEEFEEVFKMPVLTAVPESKAISAEAAQANGGPMAPESAAFQMLRTRLRYFNVDRSVKVVLVTSAAPGDGKSTTAWETAANAALMGEKALLIEAEFHRPTVASRHKLKPLPGLSELLTHQHGFADVKQSVVVGARGNQTIDLDVITAGAKPPTASTLVESDQMRQLLAQVRGEYDFVMLDTPPLLVVPDAIPLTRMVDGVIVIGCSGKTSRDEAHRLQEQLLKLDAPVLGVVANRFSRRGRGSGGYGYYYAYGDSDQKEETDATSVT